MSNFAGVNPDLSPSGCEELEVGPDGSLERRLGGLPLEIYFNNSVGLLKDPYHVIAVAE